MVDDSRDSAETLARMLTAMGCEAAFFTDARDALAEVLSSKPHIAFLDIGMPMINGYELAAMIRRWLPVSEVKLVAVTGYGTEEHRTRSRQAGFDAHVLKPIDPALVESIVRTVLDEAR